MLDRVAKCFEHSSGEPTGRPAGGAATEPLKCFPYFKTSAPCF